MYVSYILSSLAALPSIFQISDDACSLISARSDMSRW